MKSGLPGWSVPLVLVFFAGLTAFFLLDPVGHGAPLDVIEPPKPADYDARAVRKVPRRMTFDDMACSMCHDPEEPLAGNPVKKGEFHETIRLDHGRNTRCFNCHHNQRLDFLSDYDGSPIPFKKVETLCAKCHGPIFRDWGKGAHGRRRGHWDSKKGRRRTEVCIACHDPHSPAFKDLDAAPAPHVNPRTAVSAAGGGGGH